MSYNKAENTLTWPNKLVWSSSSEVQALLADVPLVALGILGLASGTLLLFTARMYVGESSPCRLLTRKHPASCLSYQN